MNAYLRSQQQDRSDFLVAVLKPAALRLHLAANELDSVIASLRYGMVSPECAMQWLYSEGLSDLLGEVEGGAQ